MDNLTIALCISIGTGVPWLIAMYSENGARQLIGNSAFGLIGMLIGAAAFAWVAPTYSIIFVILAGPLITLLAIALGQAAKRRLVLRLSRPKASE